MGQDDAFTDDGTHGARFGDGDGSEADEANATRKLIAWAIKPGFIGERPIPRNAPTGPTLIVKDDPDFEATRERLKDLIAEFHALGETGTEGNIHGFFGRLTGKQWGETQYKHVDHHLRQFGL